ncbi:hypothetical protein GIB67_038100, partial [Kingdonia uniflora]
MLIRDPFVSFSLMLQRLNTSRMQLRIHIDDLPLWGFVGEHHPDKSNGSKHLFYTPKCVTVRYNGDQIIHVNLTQESPKPLEVGKTIDVTYSVKWISTNITFTRRFNVYLDYPFFKHQIHWFSIFNSFMMVIFLTGLVSTILMRTLRNDYAKYAREDDDLKTLERDVSEESGWKLMHGDVFRPPRNLVLFSAIVGTGAQLTMLVLLVILLAIVGMLYIGRGAIVTTFIVCYALTSFISSYVSGGLYSHIRGKSWIKSMILTASLFLFMCFGIEFILNTFAIFYGSDVIASVKAELGKPNNLHPNKGKVSIFVDCSPTTTPMFEGRGGEELFAELSLKLQRCLLGSKSGAGMTSASLKNVDDILMQINVFQGLKNNDNRANLTCHPRIGRKTFARVKAKRMEDNEPINDLSIYRALRCIGNDLYNTEDGSAERE